MKIVRILAPIAIGAVAVVVAFFAFRHQISGTVAESAARHEFGSRILNVLLLGYQSDEGNSDTMLVAHLDTGRRTATLVSIPRDSWVRIPGHGYWKINAAIGFGGPKLAASVVSRIIGAPIDATVALQPEDAKAIVDTMGGLNVRVDEDMDYDDNSGDLHIHLRKGEQYLTGGQVVDYIRFRHDAASDWGRVARQQQVLKDLIDQLSLPQEWPKLPRILALARRDVQTNLSEGQVLALLQIYRGVPQDNIRSFTLPGHDGWAGEASVVFLDERWSRLIGRMLFSKQEPPTDEVTIANATGNPAFDKTVVGALRGGGWNVRTFIDQPSERATRVFGNTPAGRALAAILGTTVSAAAGAQTVLLLGRDLAPDEDG